MKIKIVCIKWREGEDFAIIDIDNIRALTKKELLERDGENKGGVGISPFIDNFNWLDCIFVTSLESLDGHCVKIVKYLGGCE